MRVLSLLEGFEVFTENLLKEDFFFFQAEDGIRDYKVTGVQTCALPIFPRRQQREQRRGDRRHAAGGDQRRLRAFQRRELGVQRELARGVVGTQVAHVVVAALTAVLISRGLEDRHLDRPGDARQRLAGLYRSEERRVGEEGRSRWVPDHLKKKNFNTRAERL